MRRSLGLLLGAVLAAALGAACAAPERSSWFADTGRDAGDESPPALDVPRPRVSGSDAPGFDETGRLVLSVEHAVVLALRHNPDLQVELFGPVVAGTFERIERGVFDAEVFAELELMREQAIESSRSTGDQFGVEARDFAGSAGVRQRFPSGTAVEATVEQERSASNRAPEQQRARFGLTVTQALLRGFGPAVNLASVRQAELGTQASRQVLRAFAEALVAEAKVAFWSYVLAEREIRIFERSLQVAERQRSDVEERIEVGTLAATEAAAARAEVALRQQELIDARSLLEARRLTLARILDPRGEGSLDFEIEAIVAPDAPPDPIDATEVEDRVALALRSRPDLAEARVRLEQNRLETVLTRDGRLPRLDAFLALGKSGYHDTFTRSFGELVGEDSYDAAIGLRLSHVLGNRAAEARHEAAWATRRQAEEAVSALERRIRLDVRLALNEVERARLQIAASAATRALRDAALEAEEERFSVGDGTALLVAQAQRDQLASRIAEAEAVIRYRIAVVDLYRAEGTLLDRHGVTLGE